MSIVYPLSLPSTPPGILRQVWRGVPQVGQTDSPFNLSQQVYLFSGERWESEITLPVMTRAQAEPWLAFLLALRGKYGTFLMGDRQGQTPRGSVPTGGALVNGANAAGSTTLATKAWTANQTGILLPGDYVGVGSGTTTRLHKVLTQANSDASGFSTLDIFPRLREALSDGAAIATSNCKGTFRLVENKAMWDENFAGLFTIAFSAIESVP